VSYLRGYTGLGSAAPGNEAYLINGASGPLTNEVNIQSLAADLSFANSTGSLINLDVDFEVVINDSSQDINFRVESNDVANFLHVDAGNNTLGIGAAATAAQFVTVTQRIATSGTPSLLVLTGAEHTTLATTVEAIDILFDIARNVQWVQGNITTQRAIQIEAPTWATATSASTFANGVNVAIDSAPNAGTNCVFTALSALRVGSADVTVGATSSGLNYATIRVPAHTATVDGTTQVTASPGVAALSLGIISINDTDNDAVTIDTGATLYIAGAPAITGGSTITLTSAYSIWVDVGKVRLDGGGTSSQVTAEGGALALLASTVNGNNASSTIAIGAAVSIGVTTYTNDTATLTMTNAASLYIAGVPVASTNVAFTNTAYSLWIDAGASRFDGQVLGPAGSASNPAYGFVADIDSGWDLPSAGRMIMYLGGAITLDVAGGKLSVNTIDTVSAVNIRLLGGMANGATAVGVALDTPADYTTEGAKAVSIRNNTVEIAAFMPAAATTGVWLVLDEADANPTATSLDADDSGAIYFKANRIVFAVNVVNTIRYLSCVIDNATVTWSVATP